MPTKLLLVLVIFHGLVLNAGEETTFKEFTSEEARFSVLFPGTPREVKQATKFEQGEVVSYQFTVDGSPYSYYVGCTDYPPAALKNSSTDQRLKTARDVFLTVPKANAKPTLVKEKKNTQDGFPGIELVVDYAGQENALIRFYAVNHRFYQVAVGGPNIDLASEDAQRFLTSFKLASSQPKPKVTGPAPVHLVVRVPANAQLELEGTKMTVIGEERRFQTPSLAPGRDFNYRLKATWSDAGETHMLERTVKVRAGETIHVDLRKPEDSDKKSATANAGQRNDLTDAASESQRKITELEKLLVGKWVRRDDRQHWMEFTRTGDVRSNQGLNGTYRVTAANQVELKLTDGASTQIESVEVAFSGGGNTLVTTTARGSRSTMIRTRD